MKNCTKNPTVTVYITNHNYGQYIEESINSVLKQTFQNFELIIIDDGSTDNSREILARYERLPNVVTIYQRNRGLNITNNIALRQSRGKYIMRLDADDFLDENALMVLSGVLDRNPMVGMVFPDFFLANEHGTVTEIVRRYDFKDVTLMDKAAHGACTMIRRRCLEQIGGYDESFTCQDGYDIWIKCIQKFKIQNVNLPLFYYRQHTCNLTRSEDRILNTRASILKKQMLCRGRKLPALGIIPVRGSNVDNRSVVLRKFAGRPLIDWTVKAALSADRLTAVAVTTPDTLLLEYIGDTYGDKVLRIRREPRLAAFNTNIEDTLFHAVDQAQQQIGIIRPEVLALLYVEAPFRTGKNIDNAIDVLEFFDTEMVICVRPETGSIYKHNGSGLQSVRQSQSLRLEREELFMEVGKMRILRRSYLEQKGYMNGGRMGHVVVTQKEAFCLNTEWDWSVGEMIAQNEQNQEGHQAGVAQDYVHIVKKKSAAQ